MITCLVNGKLYIGQTRWELYDRWSGHKHDACKRNHKTVFCKAIKKYGSENFKIELLEKVYANTDDELTHKLNEKEIYYIAKYHSLTHENGYNITKGGDNIGFAQKVKTYCFKINGELVGEFESRAAAGRFIGVRGEDVASAILRGGLCKGYYFASTPEFDYDIKKHPMKCIPVDVYSLDGDLLYSYSSCIEA